MIFKASSHCQVNCTTLQLDSTKVHNTQSCLSICWAECWLESHFSKYTLGNECFFSQTVARAKPNKQTRVILFEINHSVKKCVEQNNRNEWREGPWVWMPFRDINCLQVCTCNLQGKYLQYFHWRISALANKWSITCSMEGSFLSVEIIKNGVRDKKEFISKKKKRVAFYSC